MICNLVVMWEWSRDASALRCASRLLFVPSLHGSSTWFVAASANEIPKLMVVGRHAEEPYSPSSSYEMIPRFHERISGRSHNDHNVEYTARQKNVPSGRSDHTFTRRL